MGAIGIYLMVSTILRIDTWLEGDGTALNMGIGSYQLPTEAIHDFRLVQALLNGPVHAARCRLHLTQRIVDAKLSGAQRLTRFFHCLMIDGLTGMVEHDKESRDEKQRDESDNPYNELCGQRMS